MSYLLDQPATSANLSLGLTAVSQAARYVRTVNQAPRPVAGRCPGIRTGWATILEHFVRISRGMGRPRGQFLSGLVLRHPLPLSGVLRHRSHILIQHAAHIRQPLPPPSPAHKALSCCSRMPGATETTPLFGRAISMVGPVLLWRTGAVLGTVGYPTSTLVTY